MKPVIDSCGNDIILTWRCPKCGNVVLANPLWEKYKGEKVHALCRKCKHVSETEKPDFIVEVWVLG